MLPYLVGNTVCFVALVAADVRFGVQLLACATFGAFNAAWSLQQQRRGIEEIASRYNLPPVPRIRKRTLWYLTATFLSSLGFVGVSLFIVRLIFDAAR